MPKARINSKSKTIYLPGDVRKSLGEEGELELTPDAFVVAMTKANEKPRRILKSLEVLRRHYEILVEEGDEVV